MNHMEGKLFVLDLREAGEECITITNGQEKGGVVCRIKNEVKKTPLDEEDVANAERIVECWNACDGIPTKWIKGGAVSMIEHARSLAAERDQLTDATRRMADVIEKLTAELSGLFFERNELVRVLRNVPIYPHTLKTEEAKEAVAQAMDLLQKYPSEIIV